MYNIVIKMSEDLTSEISFPLLSFSGTICTHLSLFIHTVQNNTILASCQTSPLMLKHKAFYVDGTPDH